MSIGNGQFHNPLTRVYFRHVAICETSEAVVHEVGSKHVRPQWSLGVTKCCMLSRVKICETAMAIACPVKGVANRCM